MEDEVTNKVIIYEAIESYKKSIEDSKIAQGSPKHALKHFKEKTDFKDIRLNGNKFQIAGYLFDYDKFWIYSSGIYFFYLVTPEGFWISNMKQFGEYLVKFKGYKL